MFVISGNHLKTAPYTRGPECSGCEDGGQCRNNLCTHGYTLSGDIVYTYSYSIHTHYSVL